MGKIRNKVFVSLMVSALWGTMLIGCASKSEEIEANREEVAQADTETKTDETKSEIKKYEVKPVKKSESKKLIMSQAIQKAILDNESKRGTYQESCFDEFKRELSEDKNSVTVYGVAMYMDADADDSGVYEVSGSHMPVAITFDISEGEYKVSEYWVPQDGSMYKTSIEEKFPKDIVEEALDIQKYVDAQSASCYKRIAILAGINPKVLVTKLVEKICEPSENSDVQSYIDNATEEYRYLVYVSDWAYMYYDDLTKNSGDSGLEATILKRAREDNIALFGENEQNAVTSFTGNITSVDLDNSTILVKLDEMFDGMMPYKEISFTVTEDEAVFWSRNIDAYVRVICEDAYEETEPAKGILQNILFE